MDTHMTAHQSAGRISLDALNALDRAAFTARVGGVFEGSPWVAERAWSARPFDGLPALHQALGRALGAASHDERRALIEAHPDLAGQAALAGLLTPESSGEQAAAGLDRLSPAEVAEFEQLNAAYRARFGFPFVICARRTDKEAMLHGLRTRVEQTRSREEATALDEIGKIAWLRLQDLVETQPPEPRRD